MNGSSTRGDPADGIARSPPLRKKQRKKKRDGGLLTEAEGGEGVSLRQDALGYHEIGYRALTPALAFRPGPRSPVEKGTKEIQRKREREREREERERKRCVYTRAPLTFIRNTWNDTGIGNQ